MIISQVFSSPGCIFCSCMHVKSLQSCLTLWDAMDCSLSGSCVHGILQARILEWVAFSSFRGFSWPGMEPCLSYVLHWQVGSLPLAPPGKPYTAQSVLVAQSCPTLCDPMDCSLPASSVHVILQARIPEWVAIPFSRGSSWPRDPIWISCTAGRFFTAWTTREAP